jgi:enoyl-CoA hydratase
MTDEVLISREGGVLLITLNRPKALNALSLPMIRLIYPALRAAADDPAVKMVLIEGAGDRAFCAGGDVRAVALATREPGNPLPVEFFAEEYRLNHLIHVFPKPYVALVHGISMGGGVGLSVHGGFRVVTEDITFAMPETGIGLFPDVGGTWMLTRCPGRLGVYLGLTGARLDGPDAVYAGYATHLILPQDRAAVRAALLAAAPGDRAGVEEVLSRFGRLTQAAGLALRQPVIDRCFDRATVEEIIAALEADADPWAVEQAAVLRGKCPTSLKVTLKQIREGGGLPIADVLRREFRMTQRFMAAGDFYEGIRALLIDKDNQPRWTPATLEEVTADMVASYFAPLPGGDLAFD